MRSVTLLLVLLLLVVVVSSSSSSSSSRMEFQTCLSFYLSIYGLPSPQAGFNFLAVFPSQTFRLSERNYKSVCRFQASQFQSRWTTAISNECIILTQNCDFGMQFRHSLAEIVRRFTVRKYKHFASGPRAVYLLLLKQTVESQLDSYLSLPYTMV